MAVVVALPLKTPGDCDGSSHNGMSTLRFGGKEMLEPHRKARGGRVESRCTEESQETIGEGGRETDREQQRARLRLLTLVPVRCPMSGSGPQTWLCFLLGSHN